MTTTSIKPGDIVEVDKKGRRFRADVTGREGRELLVQPLHNNISYRRASSREIVGLWRKAGRR